MTLQIRHVVSVATGWRELCAVVLSLQSLAACAEQESLEAVLEIFGDAATFTPIEAPVIEQPPLWLGHREGEFRYRYVAGSDHGETEQIVVHRQDKDRPGRAWSRHLGDSVVEEIEMIDSSHLKIHTETDTQHGFRVTIDPGLSVPTGLKPGQEWAGDNVLTVYDVEAPDDVVYRGTLHAAAKYMGAWRVTVPAGVFDTVLLREHFNFVVGPLKADDTRYVFYAKGVGVVAEIEAVRASALLIIRVRDKSAKVLIEKP